MNELICPACGSTDIEEHITKDTISVPYGGSKVVEVVENKCKTCETTGDFADKNSIILKESFDKLKNQTIINILEDFNENNISNASIERALDIPQRTLAKWKNNQTEPSATAVALFRLIRTFPWLIEVAENKYDYTISQRIHLKSATLQLINFMKFENIEFFNTVVFSSPKQSGIHFVTNDFNNDNLTETYSKAETPVFEVY